MSSFNIAQQVCELTVDYSNVTTGNRILPFVFALDLAASNLTPGPGQNQRFCYNVTGVGDPFVDAGEPTSEDVCTNCGMDDIG